MKLTADEKTLIESRRARARQHAQIKALCDEYATGDLSHNEAMRRARSLGAYDDCNCPSMFNMCRECRHCIQTRVRENLP